MSKIQNVKEEKVLTLSAVENEVGTVLPGQSFHLEQPKTRPNPRCVRCSDPDCVGVAPKDNCIGTFVSR